MIASWQIFTKIMFDRIRLSHYSGVFPEINVDSRNVWAKIGFYDHKEIIEMYKAYHEGTGLRHLLLSLLDRTYVFFEANRKLLREGLTFHLNEIIFWPGSFSLVYYIYFPILPFLGFNAKTSTYYDYRFWNNFVSKCLNTIMFVITESDLDCVVQLVTFWIILKYSLS